MLSLLKREGRRPTNRGRGLPALRVEALETRDCPSTGPSLTFTASLLFNNTVMLSGMVLDPHPMTCAVTFSGVASGSVYPDFTGGFHLMTTATGLGTVTAQAEDDQDLFSNPAQQILTSPAPTLTLSRSYGAGNAVTLSGQVTGGSVGGCLIALGGAVNGTVTADGNGNFSYTTTSWSPGTVTAQTTDAWGQKSNAPTATLTNAPPVLTNCSASQGANNIWTFQGQVVDEFAPGETVQLSGVPTLNGSQGFTAAAVGGDGLFRFTTQLGAQDTGWVSVVAYDWIGQASDPWTTCIR